MLFFRGRGESGWCSDVTSTHGAWRHAGVRFLLSGVLYHNSDSEKHKMTPAGLEPAIPGSVGRCLIHWATGPVAILLFQTPSPAWKETILNACRAKARQMWTHWDLNPGSSACEADVIPLHHVPRDGSCRNCGQTRAASKKFRTES